jgi:3-oxoacyl-[acyl-carrier protein] reductase
MVLDGKTALVTGGTGNIALAVARALLEDGAKVALVDGDAMRLDSLIRFLRGTTLAVPAESFDAGSVRHAQQQVEKMLGPIDILVNTCDEPAPARLEAIDPEAWRFTMARNLDAAFNWCRAALPGLKERGWGRVVNVVSLAAKGVGDAGAADAASQSGLVALTFALAREAAPHGVTVNAIAAANVENSAAVEGLNDAQRRQILAGIPLARFCKPEELAHAARFLVSPLAAYVTGEVLDVNGGVVMD